MQVLPAAWGLSIPLPGVLLITLSLYLVVLGIGLWVRSCLKVGLPVDSSPRIQEVTCSDPCGTCFCLVKDRCASWCEGCCPDLSPASERCCRWVQMCDCRVPSVNSYWTRDCAVNPCVNWDCACTCQPPECDSCNCLCFEIRVR